MRSRVAHVPWATRVLAVMRGRADAWLAQPGEAPALAGGWMHEYVCPEHGVPLAFDPASPAQHRCPRGEACRGPAFDGAWRALRHRQIASVARDVALVYAATGEGAYSRAACGILSDYARRYGSYAGSADAQPWMLKGRAFHQALSEALWAVPLAQSFDLARAALAPAEAESLVAHLLRPVAATLAAAHDQEAQARPGSNYTAWLNAALGCLGFVLDDAALVERAIDGPGGFRAHLPAAIVADGFEFEGSPYYHNFVALAYTVLAEAARVNGIDLYAERGPQGQSIEATWRALAALAWPDGSLPLANDGAYWQGGPFDEELCEVYEVALARTGEPEFAWLLERAYRRRRSPRDRWTALLFAEQEVEGVESPPRPSACLPAIGLATLRTSGPSAGLAACVPFGPYGGAHGHLDRLSVQVWPFSLDPGTPPYALEARRAWYQQTAAHNAIVVDEQSQAPDAGHLVGWDRTAGIDTLLLTGDELHPGVRLSRKVTLDGGVLSDYCCVKASAERTIDWLMHVDGACTCHTPQLAQASGRLAEEGPYRFISVTARGDTPLLASLTVRHERGLYGLMLSADRPLEIMLAHGPDPERRTIIIARARGRCVSFQAYIERLGGRRGAPDPRRSRGGGS